MNADTSKMSEIELRIAYGQAWIEGRYRDAVKLLLAMNERETERKTGRNGYGSRTS
jgi:hypothetical protein